ncbi:MAG TPA: sigma factor-like helix-turn-helix DNA-binding protein [Anaeromyxobacteraceae bacterium]|nr:sigma factor-like helix-turn-helix DNA-binding protein [Anaeromyxobacteraceae bacterium]
MSEARRTDGLGEPEAVEGTALAAQEAQAAPDAEPVRQRSRTMSRKEIARDLRRQRALGIVDTELQEIAAEIDRTRPRSRADCVHGPRPCMFVSCKHHLYLDVNPETGSIKLNVPDKEIWELGETCALDVADRGGITLEEVGGIMNLTRERIRQVETRGLLKLRSIAEDEPRSGLDAGHLDDR